MLAQKFNELISKDNSTTEMMKSLCRCAISEGAVLLENDGTLPLMSNKFTLFGRCQINSFFVGYGSGGDVKPPYQVSILEGLINQNANLNFDMVNRYKKWTEENVIDEGTWGNWPFHFEEMPVTSDMVKEAALVSDIGVVVIGRSAGEDRDIKLEKGSWFLTDDELNLLNMVKNNFKKLCVIINSGSIMDLSQIIEFKPNALLLVWQGGQEFGNGVSDLLLGKTTPSGKLTDTIARIEDYSTTKYFGNLDYNIYSEDVYVGYRYFNTFHQEKIIYPFGYGLSYSKFNFKVLDIKVNGLTINLKINIKNIGKYTGKETIQIYLSKPNKRISNPKYELVYYYKSKYLNPTEEDIIECEFDLSIISSYDEINNCYLFEKGKYNLFIGLNSIDIEKIYSFDLDDIIIKKTKEACAPNIKFLKMINNNGVIDYEEVITRSVDLEKRILNNLNFKDKFDVKDYKYDQLLNEDVSIDEFVNSLDFIELEALTRGSLYSMNSPYGPLGNAGTLGASNEQLFKRGVPKISTNDGPSGVRLSCYATQIPNGVLLASTFNDDLVEAIAYEIGKEVRLRKSHILLAPGINIHRNPLCGRNFEYYSEDPYLTAMIASAYVKGVQKAKASACLKHFACNNQENKRHSNDSILSQRCLREIYLRAFEICINKANPDVIMTSYNLINGDYSYYNYDLIKVILRDEFGFDGLLITDWWMTNGESKLFKGLKTQALRIRSAVDVYMPGSTGDFINPGVSDGTLKEALDNNLITLAEIRYCAKNVIKYCLKLSSYGNDYDKENI